MLYVSHLIDDEQIKRIMNQTGAGLEAIEFSVSDNLDALPVKIEKFKERLKRLEVQNLTLHGPYLDLNPASYDSRILSTTRLRFEQAYEAAAELGASKLIFHTGFIYHVHFLEDWAERLADFFNNFLEGRQGITVCLENVYDRDPGSPVKVKTLVESPDFALCLDTGHAHCNSEVPLEEWIAGFAPYTSHIHVHDNDGRWDYHRGLGSGTIDLDTVMPLLKSSMPDADIVIECPTAEDIIMSYKVLERYNLSER